MLCSCIRMLKLQAGTIVMYVGFRISIIFGSISGLGTTWFYNPLSDLKLCVEWQMSSYKVSFSIGHTSDHLCNKLMAIVVLSKKKKK